MHLCTCVSEEGVDGETVCSENPWVSWFRFVYYESIKRELKTRPIYECRCDERLKRARTFVLGPASR
jgi:hypothetical protein